MGAGIDPNVYRRMKYRRLKAEQRRLQSHGIPCEYRNLEVYGEHFVVYFAGCGPASNGERFAWLVLRFNPVDEFPSSDRKHNGDIDYTDNHTRDIPERIIGGYEAGVARVVLSQIGELACSQQ